MHADVAKDILTLAAAFIGICYAQYANAVTHISDQCPILQNNFLKIPALWIFSKIKDVSKETGSGPNPKKGVSAASISTQLFYSGGGVIPFWNLDN